MKSKINCFISVGQFNLKYCNNDEYVDDDGRINPDEEYWAVGSYQVHANLATYFYISGADADATFGSWNSPHYLGVL